MSLRFQIQSKDCLINLEQPIILRRSFQAKALWWKLETKVSDIIKDRNWKSTGPWDSQRSRYDIFRYFYEN